MRGLMLGIGPSGHESNSGFSEPLKFRVAACVSCRVVSALLLALCCVFSGSIGSQAQTESGASSISAYADAIKKSTIAERITAMEHYLSIAGGSNLKVDALE